MSVINRNTPLATSAVAPPSLLTQVGMAGTSAVITVRSSYAFIVVINSLTFSDKSEMVVIYSPVFFEFNINR